MKEKFKELYNVIKIDKKLDDFQKEVLIIKLNEVDEELDYFLKQYPKTVE